MEDPLVGQIIAAEALKRMPRVAPSAGPLPARGQNTAGYVKKMGAELTPDVPLREVIAPVVAPDTPAGLALKELQAKTLTRLQTKPDYSGLEEINRSRAEMGAPEVGAGLYMSILGGRHMKEAGGTMLKEALKNREPIRPNAADIGWTDPAAGKVVENPMLRETRDTAVLQHQLDQAIKTKEYEITEARRLGDQALAEQKHKELLAMMAQKQGATIIHNNMLDEAAMVRAQRAGGGVKAVPASQQRDLEGKVTAIDNLAGSLSSFDDMYAGGWGPLSKARVAMASTAGGLAPKDDEQRANWWKNFGMFQTLPMRHALFGSALTPSEKASWDAVQEIQPGSSPATVKAAITKLLEAARDKHGRLSKQLTNEGKDVSAYELQGQERRAPPKDAAFDAFMSGGK